MIGVPDERLGEEVCAWVRKKPDVDLTQQSLRQFCKGQVSIKQNKIRKQGGSDMVRSVSCFN